MMYSGGFGSSYRQRFTSFLQMEQAPAVYYPSDEEVGTSRMSNDAGISFQGWKIAERGGAILASDDPTSAWCDLALERGKSIRALSDVLDRHVHALRGLIRFEQVRLPYHVYLGVYHIVNAGMW